jgi:hypothetical protein
MGHTSLRSLLEFFYIVAFLVLLEKIEAVIYCRRRCRGGGMVSVGCSCRCCL